MPTVAPSTNSAVAPTVRRQLPAMDIAVDAGFAILLIVCGIRYFSRHPLEGVGVAALMLAVGAGVSYAVAVVGRRALERTDATSAGLDAVGTREGVGLLVATACWLPLVVLAPSFGWCGFALFFAVHRVIQGSLALVISGALVIAVSTGLFLMSNGDDLGLVLGPFFGGLVLAYAYSALDRALEEQRKLIDQLVETRAQLARSERDAGALAERERVASELHDTVVQRTATALLMLESDELRTGAQSAAVADARDALREGLVETRQLLHGLADPRLNAQSLPEALESQAFAAGAEFSVSGTVREVSEAVSHALQRVVQEALTNVRKHANATSAHVTLTFFDTEVGADIADDGDGFVVAESLPQQTPPEAALHEQASPAQTLSEQTLSEQSTGGFGLRAMTWRIKALGGELTIESYPGEGTVVAAIVPTFEESS